MKGSVFALFSLTFLLAGAVMDAGSSRISHGWIPALSLVTLTSLMMADRDIRRRIGPVLWPLAAWLALWGVYVVNPTHVWQDGVGLLPRSSIPFLPGSAHRAYSAAAWIIGATAACLFMLALCVRREEWRWMQWIVLVGAAAVAFAALNDRLVHRAFPVFERTGPFVYENHYAAFANLLLPVTLAAGLRFRYAALRSGRLYSPAGVAVVVSLMLAVSIVLSGSRAGMALMMLTGLMAWWWMSKLERRCSHKLTRSVRINRPLLIGALVVWIAALALAIYRYGESVPRLGQEIHFRFTMIADAWRIWLNSFWWGTGPGTYRVVIPYYQSESLGAVQIAHAHCEPVQWLAELGLVGVSVSLALIGFAWGRARPAVAMEPHEWPTFEELEIPAFGLALLTLFLHSLIDFPWRMPTIVWVAAVWLGMGCCRTAKTGSSVAA